MRASIKAGRKMSRFMGPGPRGIRAECGDGVIFSGQDQPWSISKLPRQAGCVSTPMVPNCRKCHAIGRLTPPARRWVWSPARSASWQIDISVHITSGLFGMMVAVLTWLRRAPAKLAGDPTVAGASGCSRAPATHTANIMSRTRAAANSHKRLLDKEFGLECWRRLMEKTAGNISSGREWPYSMNVALEFAVLSGARAAVVTRRP